MNGRLNSRGIFIDDEGMAHANDEMRNDPARKAAVKARIEEIQTAHAKAHDLLRLAVAEFNTVGYIDEGEDALARRSRDALARALTTFDQNESSVMREPNDTYLGNKAAFGAPYGWTPES